MTQTPRRVYVGIPVNDYKHFQSLQYCVPDAWHLSAELKQWGGYDACHVLTEPTSSAIRQRLRTIVATMRTGDMLVLHLALHGALDANDDQLFLLGAATGKPDREHFLIMSELRDLLGAVAGMEVVFLVDSCRAALGGVNTTLAQASRRVGVTLDRDTGARKAPVRLATFIEIYACQDHAVAYEFDALRQGLFTQAFLNVMMERIDNYAPLLIDHRFEADLVRQMRTLCDQHQKGAAVNPFLRKPAGHVATLVPARKRRSAVEAGQVVEGLVAPEPRTLVVPKPAVPAGRVPAGCRKAAGENRLDDGWWRRVEHIETGIVLVRIPAGSFDMGSNDGNSNEKPVHRVEISKPFYLGETAVTVGEWRKFAVTGYRTEAETRGTGWSLKPGKWVWEWVKGADWQNPIPLRYYRPGDDHPVTQVSWNDVVKFCEQYGFVLPTEAQREYACRAGTKSKWWWGDDPSGAARHCNLAGQETKSLGCSWASEWDDGYPFLAPVRAREGWKNGFGLYSMAGQVWEWCEDFFADDYYGRSESKDPVNRVAGASRLRVARGGSWYSYLGGCRAAYRDRIDPSFRNEYLGFRVARTIAE